MATYKLTTIFNQGRAGWSESWYVQASNHDQALTKLKNNLPSRQGLLGGGAAIEYVRVSDVAIEGDSQIAQLFEWSVGTAPTGADEPWDSVYLRCEAGPLYRRQMHLRGIPDAWVGPAGSFPGAPPMSGPLNKAVERWAANARGNGFQIRVTEKEGAGAIKTPVTGGPIASGAQTAVTIAANVGAVGEYFRMTEWSGPDKKLLNGRHKILDKVGNLYTINLKFALMEDPGDNTGGKALPIIIAYKDLQDVIIVRMAKKATGRAFFSPVGRR